MAAFVPAAPVTGASFSGGNALCVNNSPASVGTVTMGSRRDLKKEKAQRNLEFARSHRKKVVRNFNRRAIQNEKTNLDNEYLSSVFGTIRFGWKDGDEDGKDGKTNDWRGSQNKGDDRGHRRGGSRKPPRK